MAEPAVSYTVEDDIAVIVLERAEARNAINIDILEGLSRDAKSHWIIRPKLWRAPGNSHPPWT